MHLKLLVSVALGIVGGFCIVAGGVRAADNCFTTFAGNTKLTLLAPVQVTNAPPTVSRVDVNCLIRFELIKEPGTMHECWAYTANPGKQPSGQLTNGAYNGPPLAVEVMYDSTRGTPRSYKCTLRRHIPGQIAPVEAGMIGPGDVVEREGNIATGAQKRAPALRKP